MSKLALVCTPLEKRRNNRMCTAAETMPISRTLYGAIHEAQLDARDAGTASAASARSSKGWNLARLALLFLFAFALFLIFALLPALGFWFATHVLHPRCES